MTTVEQALREALEWALTEGNIEGDVAPPPAVVMATIGRVRDAAGEYSRYDRRLTINDAYLDGLRGKP